LHPALDFFPLDLLRTCTLVGKVPGQGARGRGMIIMASHD
jgi:hypothetical protein